MGSVADVDGMMYECGVEVLHPGGLAKSDEMARRAGVRESKLLLDVGVGRGTTACHLARTYGCRVLGVDVSPHMIEAAREKVRKEGVEDLVDFRVADACELPFEDESFNTVLIECVTTLLDRRRAFPEFVRVLKTGGCLGDLEMIYRKEPPGEFAWRLSEEWGGFTSMTLEGWRALFERHGLEVVETDDFSDLLPGLSKTIMRELGLRGCIKMIWRLMLHGDLRRTMKEYMRIFEEGKDVFGYAYLVGAKR